MLFNDKGGKMNSSEVKAEQLRQGWQQRYDEVYGVGKVTITHGDVEEIKRNLVAFFEILHRWDKELGHAPTKMGDAVAKPKAITPSQKEPFESTKAGKRLLNVKEIAEALQVPASWIYQRTMQGQKAIPHHKFGKYVRFDADAVIAHFARGEKDNECTS